MVSNFRHPNRIQHTADELLALVSLLLRYDTPHAGLQKLSRIAEDDCHSEHTENGESRLSLILEAQDLILRWLTRFS